MPAPRGAHALDERALGHQLDLDVAGLDQVVGGRAHARPRRERHDQLADLAAGHQQHAAQLADGAQAVADQRQVPDALVARSHEQAAREAVTGAEPRDGDRGAVVQVGQGRFR